MENMPPELDPRRPIIEVMARIGRETQITLDEREKHFKITDTVIVVVSLLLIILAVVNVYFVRVLYQDMGNIVGSMESMMQRIDQVDADMVVVADHVDSFSKHMRHMSAITRHVTAVTQRLPEMRKDMVSMALSMDLIHADMSLLRLAVGSITPSMVQMTQNISIMRHDVHDVAGPMGTLNPVLP
jgi:hypothetical protein